MSFAICAIHRNDVFIAADSQITANKAQITMHGFNKIFKINDSTAIALCGNVSFTELVKKALSIRLSKTTDEIDAPLAEQIILLDLATADQNWTRFNKVNAPEAVILIAGFDGPNPYISAIALYNHKIDVIHNRADIGEYEFIPAIPPDLEPFDCIELCQKHLLHAELRSRHPKEALESLVVEISKSSSTVDDRTEILTLRPKDQMR